MPIVEGSEGERAIDVSSLRADTGLITLDPGYANTGSALSEITYIDGEEGILRYRGYPIEELAERSSFVETSYLILHGELPTTEQLEHFSGADHLPLAAARGHPGTCTGRSRWRPTRWR